MNEIEKVLCINRAALPESWIEPKTILPMTLEQFIHQCSQSGYAFSNRPQAEQDPEKKQIIPYILLQSRDGEKTAVYNRQGSEKRLHDLWSAGIGGHINPIDRQGAAASFKEILISGMERELDEELIQRPKTDRVEFSGVISEDITPVGSVHLGAVFRILTADPQAYLPGPELFGFKWIPTKTLSNLNLELWSELALSLVDAKKGRCSG